MNPDAVETATANAARNGVADQTKFFLSDLFDQVSGEFDLVVFDPPFRWFRPRNMRERGTADENYETMTGFFEQVDRYLRPGGRILLFFGSSGDITYLRHLIKCAGLRSKVLASLGTEKDGLKVKYYTYKLTRPTKGR